MAYVVGESSHSSVRNKKDSDERKEKKEKKERNKERASLEEKKEKQHEEILKIEANMFQLANYYFVFQGVILTAIFKDSSATPKCKYIWVPICLSLVAVLLNLFALCIMADKYKHSLKELDRVNKKLHEHMKEGRKAQLEADAQQKQLEIAKKAADEQLAMGEKATDEQLAIAKEAADEQLKIAKEAADQELAKAEQAAGAELNIITEEHKNKECQRDKIWISSMGFLILFAILNILGTILIPCEI